MKNPENYRQVNTCHNCPTKKPYISGENKVFYSCPNIDNDDIDSDHYCGKHPEINNGDSYQVTSCCFNCFSSLKSYLKGNIFYECMATAETLDDGSEISPDCLCNIYKKDNGGVF